MVWRLHPASAEGARPLPPPVSDEAPGAAFSETTVLAGGCFWGVQGVFQHVKGVSNAVSGYAGGSKSTAEYEAVSTGTTGHAESVQITFDPREISYGRLLQIFFSVAHDPTELNRQGPDEGTQYRSAIFPANPEQARVAQGYISQINALHVFRSALATRIQTNQTFYRAEDYHQDFLTLNPKYPYIVVNDLPKIEDLKRLFPDLYRASPVLVSSVRSAR
jgi:peptide-methionine (S)-S-oxide reductase